MSASRFDSLLSPLKQGELARDAQLAARLNAITELLQETAQGRHVRGGPGMLVSTGVSGVSVRTRRPLRPAVQIHPFFVFDGTGYVHTGTVNGYVPKLGTGIVGVGETPLPTMEAYNGYVYIRAIYEVSFEHHLLKQAVLKQDPETMQRDIEVIKADEPQMDGLDMMAFEFTTYRLVAHVIEGVVQRQQNTTGSLNITICDQSSGEDNGEALEAFWTQ